MNVLRQRSRSKRGTTRFAFASTVAAAALLLGPTVLATAAVHPKAPATAAVHPKAPATAATHPKAPARAPAAVGGLTIDETVNSATARHGDTLTYTMTVKNRGQLGAASVAATDLLPAGETFVSATGNAAHAGGAIDWMIPTLPAGDQARLTAVARVDAGTAAETLVNEFAVTNPAKFAAETVNHACAGDPGMSCATTTVTRLVTVAGLALHELVESAPGSGRYIEADASNGLTGKYAIGDTVRWESQVVNTGNVALTGVVVTDPLVPACAKTIASIPTGQQATVTCTSIAGAVGSFTNTATATDTGDACDVSLSVRPDECRPLTSTDMAAITVGTIPKAAPSPSHTEPVRKPVTQAVAGSLIDTGLGANAGTGVSRTEIPGGIALLALSAAGLALVARRRRNT